MPGRPTPDASAPPQNLLAGEQRKLLVSTDESFGFDRQRIRYLDKVVSTDGDGWKLGMPLRVR